MNNKLFKSILLIGLLELAFDASAVTPSYTFANLGTLGGCCSSALSINNFGQITGYSNTTNNLAQHATAWNSSGATDIGTLGGQFSFGISINNSGQVAGISDISGNGAQHATLWNGVNATDLGTLGANNSSAFAINNAGKVAGFSVTNNTTGVAHATVWDSSGVTDIGTLGGNNSIAYSINDAGQVVGYSDISSNQAQHATLWNGANATDLGTLGGAFSLAINVNNSGQAVGVSTTSDNITHATIWNGTSATALETLGGTQSFASAINNNLGVLTNSIDSFAWAVNESGQVVGFSSKAGITSHLATMWDSGKVIDLNSLLDQASVSAGWELNEAKGINANGWIVGSASNRLLGITETAFLMSVTPVPEPETNAMMLIGLGLMGFVARCRKQA